MNNNCPECDRLLAAYSHALNEFAWVEAKFNAALLSDAGATDMDTLEAKRQSVAAARDFQKDEFTAHYRNAHCTAPNGSSGGLTYTVHQRREFSGARS